MSSAKKLRSLSVAACPVVVRDRILVLKNFHQQILIHKSNNEFNYNCYYTTICIGRMSLNEQRRVPQETRLDQKKACVYGDKAGTKNWLQQKKTKIFKLVS
jgi:hypothetical protein